MTQTPVSSTKRQISLSRTRWPRSRQEKTITILSSFSRRTSEHWSCPPTDFVHQQIEETDPTGRAMGRWHHHLPCSRTEELSRKERNAPLWWTSLRSAKKPPLRGEIISRSHDHITAGHPGIDKTKELVLQGSIKRRSLVLQEFWWPKMKKDVEAYVKGCKNLSTNKNQARKPRPLRYTQTQIPRGALDSYIRGHGHWITWLTWTRRNPHDRRPIFEKRSYQSHCNVWNSRPKDGAQILWDHVYAKHGMPPGRHIRP